MLKEFVEKILELKQPPTFVVSDRPYSIDQLHQVRDPAAAAIKVATITGIVDYLRENPDELELKDVVVHVAAHDQVSVLSRLRLPWRDREAYMIASRENHAQGFDFGRYMDTETFIVQLQSRIQDSDQRAAVLRLVGNLRTEKLQTNADDGVTQTAATRAGIVLAGQETVPNPVKLAPFRTFSEVHQPASEFIFRLKQSREGELPQAALFEADGGAWKLEAIDAIAEYLKGKIPGEVQLLA